VKEVKKTKNGKKFLSVKQLDELSELVETLFLSFFVVLLLFTYVFQLSTVDGNSMENTLKGGEQVLSGKFLYKAETGDVIVMFSEYSYLLEYETAKNYAYADIIKQISSEKLPEMSETEIAEKAENNIEKSEIAGTPVYRINGLNKRIVKRVIATGGQEVKINFENGDVLVDGKLLDEPYIKNLTNLDENAFKYPFVVPEGYVFVLGDNRAMSKDSRHPNVGLVQEDYIIGKIIFRIFPFDKIGFVD
jgi:signal peptidase I